MCTVTGYQAPRTRPHRCELYQDRKGEWRWRLRAHNGRIVCDGAEGYKTKGGAKRGFERVSMVFAEGTYIVEAT